MRSKTISTSVTKKSEAGLSTMELMIAITIFLIVIGAVYGILKLGNTSRTTINTRSENIKNVRLAVNTIGREVVNAGLGYNRVGGTVPDDFTTYHFGTKADVDNDNDLLTAISSGSNIAESDLSGNGVKNDIVAFAFRDIQFNDGFPVTVTDVTEKDGKLILKTPDGACANCRPFDLFLVETGEGKRALVLSTDIVNNNQIVLGGADADRLNINYGKDSGGGSGGGGGGSDYKCTQDDEDGDNGNAMKDACKDVYDAQARVDDILEDNDPSKAAELAMRLAELKAAQNKLNGLVGIVGSGGSTGSLASRSAVKKCSAGETVNCIDYGSTTVVAKKIYLVSYNVAVDGTLIRTTYGNNTGAGADDQIVRQPIANGVRSFKINYLLNDGTTTSDPSEANTQKERNNDIIQIEVSVTVDSEKNSSEPITLTSTFSTRNLKYDVY